MFDAKIETSGTSACYEVFTAAKRKTMIELFNRRERKVALSRFGTASHHKHYFGGKPGDFGFTISDDAPLHLIYAFDTSDPLIPFESEQALFPFFYGFAFGGRILPTKYGTMMSI